MQPTHLASIFACAILLSGCGPARMTTGNPITERESGKQVQFYNIQGEWNVYGLQAAGAGGSTITKPIFSGFAHNVGIIFVKLREGGQWARLRADGRVEPERWTQVFARKEGWLLVDGKAARLVNLELSDNPPVDLAMLAGDARLMVNNAKRWTDANRANLGTQSLVRNDMEYIERLLPYIEGLAHPPAQKSRFYEAYADLAKVALSTFYHTNDMRRTTGYFGSYLVAAMRVRDNYAHAIRHHDGKDNNRESRLRGDRLHAALAILSADERVTKSQLEVVLNEANEDLAALDEKLGQKDMVAGYTAELQKVLPRHQ